MAFQDTRSPPTTLSRHGRNPPAPSLLSNCDADLVWDVQRGVFAIATCRQTLALSYSSPDTPFAR